MVITTLLSVPFSLLGSSNLLENSNKFKLKQENYTPINHIHIWSNDDFAIFNFPGSGIEEDPYIIEGYEITTLENDLIFISGTNVYFIIRNNLLLGENSNNQFGITLTNTRNGLIENNIITGADKNGVQIEFSENIIFTNNVISNNENWGIYLFRNSNIQFYNNLIRSNGFEGVGSYESYNNYWANNTIVDHFTNGVRFELTDSTVFISNMISGNGDAGIWLSEAHNNIIQLNHFTNNGVGVAISHDDLTTESTNNLIIQNTITSNSNGIFIWDGEFNTITNNYIVMNEFMGIRIQDGSDNIFSHNTISNNNIGLEYIGASYRNIIQCNSILKSNLGIRLALNQGNIEEKPINEISYNILKGNLGEGVFIKEGEGIVVKNNDFIENEILPQAFDNGVNNTFVQNYWSDIGNQDRDVDGINDIQYNIGGFGNNNDNKSSPVNNVNLQDGESFCNSSLDAVGEINTNTTIQLQEVTSLTLPVDVNKVLIIPFLTVLTFGAIILYRKKVKLSSTMKSENIKSDLNIGFDE